MRPSVPRSRVAVAVGVLLMLGAQDIASAQKKSRAGGLGGTGFEKKNRREPGSSEFGPVRTPMTTPGVGNLVPGQTASGHIGESWNSIRFQVIEGTRISLSLKCDEHPDKIIGELRDQRRTAAASLELNDETSAYEISDFLISKSGVWVLRFGLRGDRTGTYELTTTAVVPDRLERSLEFDEHGVATFKVHGQTGRLIKKLDIDVDPGDRLTLDLLMRDSFGADIDTGRKVRSRGLSGVSARNLQIDGFEEYEFVVSNREASAGTATVTIDFENPEPSPKAVKI